MVASINTNKQTENRVRHNYTAQLDSYCERARSLASSKNLNWKTT